MQNPFRYRGYYYDSETGLYYLQSRYYAPIVGRYINADALLDTSHILGFNIFVYCVNNPINYIDPTGFCYRTSDGKWVNCETGGFVQGNSFDGVKASGKSTKNVIDPRKNELNIESSFGDFVKGSLNSVGESLVGRAGIGIGYGREINVSGYGLSAKAAFQFVNVEISNTEINFYASVYAGASISVPEGLGEIGPEIHVIFDYKTKEFYNVSEDLFRLPDLGNSISAYTKGIGASLEIGFEELY